jgi:hypothetical protein
MVNNYASCWQIKILKLQYSFSAEAAAIINKLNAFSSIRLSSIPISSSSLVGQAPEENLNSDPYLFLERHLLPQALVHRY